MPPPPPPAAGCSSPLALISGITCRQNPSVWAQQGAHALQGRHDTHSSGTQAAHLLQVLRQHRYTLKQHRLEAGRFLIRGAQAAVEPLLVQHEHAGVVVPAAVARVCIRHQVHDPAGWADTRRVVLDTAAAVASGVQG
jgi:hypothetical protein